MKFGATVDMYHLMKTTYSKMIIKQESVEICDTGFGTHGITPAECEQRIEMTETDIECIKKDIERLEVEIEKLKFKIDKKIV